MAEITYNLLKSEEEFKNLPILTLDQRWYKLVPEAGKTDEIRYWEKQVNDLLKKRGQLNEDILNVKKIKKKIINNIVQNMESDANEAKHKKIMSRDERLMYEAKDKLAELTNEADGLPQKLAYANQMLFVETVKVCYQTINSNNAELKVLDKWIEQTRITLKKNLLIQQDKESTNEQIYSYMHAILGRHMMEMLDNINDA